MTPAELRAWREARPLNRAEADEILGLSARMIETLEYGRSPAASYGRF